MRNRKVWLVMLVIAVLALAVAGGATANVEERGIESSTLWDSSGPREPGQVFYITSNTTFRWMATDIKGNVSFGIKRYRIGTP
jgi:hypothetical protein